MKKINEAGIKFSMRSKKDQPYGGSTWDTSKKQLMTYYVMVGVMVDDSEGIDSKSFKGYERFNSYTQSYVKILSMYPKDGGDKYNYIVKGMIGVAEERSDDELKFAAKNSIAKILNDLNIYPMTPSSEFPCKIVKGGEDDGGISKEMRPRGKEFNESKKHTIRLTESQMKSIITESVKKVLKEYDENYVDSNAYADEYMSYPYPVVVEETYGLKGVFECVEEWDVESLAQIIMEGIENGVFNDAQESPIQIYDRLIKDIPHRAKQYYQSVLESCKLGREWVSESYEVHGGHDDGFTIEPVDDEDIDDDVEL